MKYQSGIQVDMDGDILVLFGGSIGIRSISLDDDECKTCGIGLQTIKSSSDIGTIVKGGGDTAKTGPSINLMFNKPESIDIIISHLQKVKSMLEGPKKTRVIFLDIDGVITNDSGIGFDNIKMDMIEAICCATDAKIVISSSWRRNNLADTIKELTGQGDSYVPVPYTLEQYTIDITPYVIANETREGGRQFHVQRGVEIDLWLQEHDVDNYVILDDDKDILYCQAPHFINVDCKKGITSEDCSRAIKILKEE